QHQLDGLLVDNATEADLLGVLGGHVHGHVVVEDLNGQVLALLPKDGALFLLHNRPRAVMRVDHLLADVEQPDLPIARNSPRRRRGSSPTGERRKYSESVSKMPPFPGIFGFGTGKALLRPPLCPFARAPRRPPFRPYRRRRPAPSRPRACRPVRRPSS